MVSPFRRKGKDSTSKTSEDLDLDEAVNESEVIALGDGEPSPAELPESVEVEPEEANVDMDELMEKSAITVIDTCMDLRRGENILIVCDPTTTDIGQALHNAASKRSDRVLLVVMPKGRHHGEEPPAPVVNLMRQQQVVIAPTRYSLTHTRAVRQAIKDGARVATMPGMTNEMFTSGGMSADFASIKKNMGEMAPVLRRKRIVNVKSEAGTNVTFEVNWREWKLDDNGICNRPRMLTNLPAGKIFTLPREGTMNGTIVIDGSWDSALVDEPIVLQIEDGLVVDVKGGTAAAQIRQAFGEAAKRLRSKEQENVWTVAEFGFGMNPQARLMGSVLEDEKRMGTAYFSIGDNTTLGGASAVGIHVSGVMNSPSIWLDETELVKDGQFIIK
ncbi:MAG: aminopeptidase [Candidatus Poseidonia sp.]|uniref:aminopeptidase n=1 Tax=Poseidonia sp. TaxID=2666344 RepID=UPI0030BC1CC4|nr:aminopeptidase [Poseidonia sp.]MDG1552525.1 aminopeptidase [Poseidonia sp.]